MISKDELRAAIARGVVGNISGRQPDDETLVKVSRGFWHVATIEGTIANQLLAAAERALSGYTQGNWEVAKVNFLETTFSAQRHVTGVSALLDTVPELKTLLDETETAAKFTSAMNLILSLRG